MTTYEQVKDWFFTLIEKDEDFFNYYDIPTEEAIAIAEQRASNYMEEAVSLITLKCLPQIDFSKRTEDNTGFDFDFSYSEQLLVPSLMYQFYLFRDFSKLKTYNVNFTSTEIKVFDPSNARTTFMEMYNSVVTRNDQLIDDYKNTDRKTGKYRAFNPADMTWRNTNGTEH